MKVTKKLLALLLGLTLMVSMGISVGATEADSTNLLTNPSFENGLEGWTAIRTTHNLESALSMDYVEDFTAHTDTAGSKYVKFPSNYGKSVLTQKVSGLSGGDIYKFNAYVYTITSNPEISLDTYIYITYSFYSGDTVLGTATEVQQKTALTSWTKLESSIVLPNDADGLEIGIIHKGGDSFTRSYDELSLEKISFIEPDGNLLLNSGFEAGSTNWEAKRNGSNFDPLREYGKIYTNLHSTEVGLETAPSDAYGSNFMYFRTNTSQYSLKQKVTNIKEGESYKFIGDVLATATNNSTSPAITVICTSYKEDGNVIRTDTFETKILMNNWCTVEAVFTLPDDTDSIDIGVEAEPKTSVYHRYFDNFYLVPTDNLLGNSSFEDKTIGWSATSDVDSQTDFISHNSHSDGLAFTGQTSKWGRMEQYLLAKPGAKYKLTYWFKSVDASVAKKSAVSIRFFEEKPTGNANRSNESLCHIELNTLPLLSSDGWQQYVGYFTAPQNAQGMSVVVKSYSSSGGTGNCIYDDMELSFVDQDIEFVGFSDVNPATLTGVETVLNEASFKDSSSYSSLVNGVKTPAVTLNKITEVNNSSSIFASAVAPSAPDTALVFALFSENGGKKKLEAIDIAKPDENGLITTGITVPETGSYYAEAYILNSMGGLKPITDPIELN